MKNRKRIKRRIKVVMLLVIVYTMYIGTTKLFSDGYKGNIKQGNEYKQQVIEDVKKSNNSILNAIIDNGKGNLNSYKIVDNNEEYPEELLELASKKVEAIDFVAGYPEYKGYNEESISIKKEYKQNEIPLFMQWDKRWGYEKYGQNFIAINGCGPTAIAMVAAGLTGNTNINPKIVADYSKEQGYLVKNLGTSWSLMTEGAKNFGIVGREIPLSETTILNTLKKGQPIIASMGPGTFTTEGHFIVLTGIDENNKIIVNDSDSKIRSKKTWDIDIFLSQTKNLWAFKTL